LKCGHSGPPRKKAPSGGRNSCVGWTMMSRNERKRSEVKEKKPISQAGQGRIPTFLLTNCTVMARRRSISVGYSPAFAIVVEKSRQRASFIAPMPVVLASPLSQLLYVVIFPMLEALRALRTV